MIKNIIDLSEKELGLLLNSDYDVVEKLDMYYFRLNITKAGIFVTKNSTDKVISDIDCITNWVFKNIVEYSKEYEKISDQILEIYGDCRIGIFYNMSEASSFGKSCVNYMFSVRSDVVSSFDMVKKYDKNFHGTFILSDIFTSTKALNNEKNFDKLIKSINDAGILLFPKPIIMHINKLNDKKKVIRTINQIKEVKNKTAEKNLYLSLIRILCNKSSDIELHIYASSLDKCEGIIFRNDSIQCKIQLCNYLHSNIDSSDTSKIIYRDIVLSSFASELMKDETLIDRITNSNDNYIDKVSSLFIKYIENTDLLSKYTIEPEDLLPPGLEYVLKDIDYSYINNSTIITICKYNQVYMNIFRLLLHSLSKKISDNKFSELPDNISSYLNKLIIALKYKNYKEIAYELYKSKN